MDSSTSLRFAQGSLVKAIDPGSLSAVEVTPYISYMHEKTDPSTSLRFAQGSLAKAMWQAH